jgi:uncharacterized protein
MDQEDGAILLRLARESITTAFSNDEPNINEALHMDEEQGVFVTIHKNGDLRGCIGYPEPVMPLYKAVIEAARSAAFQDSRFSQMIKTELREIDIEISVLTIPELIKIEKPEDYLKQITIGEDGLIIRHPAGSGLLLPQVATENNFSVAQFLNCLCQKAYLPFSAWQDPQTQIFKFQAEIFSEK